MIIPARGGSKGIPGKNLRELTGKPLLLWTVESALASTVDGPVVVSTDDSETASVAAVAGSAVVERPAELAMDESPTEPAVIHAVLEMEERLGMTFDPVILLQPTSPFRNGKDIDSAMDRFCAAGADSLLSVCPSHSFLWKEKASGGYAEPLNYDFMNRPRRQEMAQFEENGAIYITGRNLYIERGCRLGEKIVLFEMPRDRSLEIDSLFDLWLAERILDHRSDERF